MLTFAEFKCGMEDSKGFEADAASVFDLCQGRETVQASLDERREVWGRKPSCTGWERRGHNSCVVNNSIYFGKTSVKRNKYAVTW
jgi:hypothetical protein